MKEVSISEFKAKCSKLLEQVRKTKRPIRINRYNVPLAEIVPPSLLQKRSAWIGSMKDSITILGDIISPAHEPSEWHVLRD